MPKSIYDKLQGTLTLLVLKTLNTRVALCAAMDGANTVLLDNREGQETTG
jgi:hypothetical protein